MLNFGEEERALGMVSVKNMGWKGRRISEGVSQYSAVSYVSGMLCDLSGKDLEKAAEKCCPCGAIAARMCISNL